MRADVAVVGAGHNGLVWAAYLARGGLDTLVLERREIVGGACVTEDLWPGYRISRAAPSPLDFARLRLAARRPTLESAS